MTEPRRYATVEAFDAALKRRLVARAGEHRTIQELRKQIGFDRILARLHHVAPDAWLLKGGVALEYRLQQARATVDVDISTHLSLDQMTNTLRASTAVELNDYFGLRLGQRSKPVEDVGVYRFKLTVLYEDDRVFEELKLDVGFADPGLGEPQELTAPPFLEFAGIKPTTVRAVSIEQHLAEKIHAYTKPRGNRESTRVKDLVDMALLIDDPLLDKDLLAETVRTVFARCATHDIPATLPEPPLSWRVAYPRLAANLPVPQTSDEAHRHVAEALEDALEVTSSLR